MIISVFKTNVLEQEQARKILAVLSGKYPDYKINFDLSIG
jgi:hypothetical protein